MVSKNNLKWKQQRDAQRVPHYGLRKLSVGVASVLLSTTLYMGATASADTVAETNPQPTTDQPASTATGTSTGDATADAHAQPAADQSANAAANNSASETDTSTKSVSADVSKQPANVVDTQSVSVVNGTQPAAATAANNATPTNDANADSAPAMLPKQPANTADTQPAETANHMSPFMNLAVTSTNEDLTPKRETVDSKWTLHYVNQADHKQELKAPTVITMQYERTNTPQSDGTTKYGDWSFVPGSFKQTGTLITVKDSDNPVKQDNIVKNGENMDVFAITAMYPTITGHTMYNGVNGTRLHDNLRNDGTQADSMSKDFYAEYDVAKPARETVGSQWRIHYIDSTNREHELKAPTVINMQYERTNTPQSDGTIQHGDWSYVPGSYKQTGTPITVDDSDNPVKQDNVNNDGKNEDVFTITINHPAITGYAMHDNITRRRLQDHLLNYAASGEFQLPTMGRDVYVEYDPIDERSVAVKFIDDQYVGQQVGQAITLTGHDGDTVNLKLTVPDKYQLADGQQLPTSYTFAKGSGDLKIHLTHKVVQRKATINVLLWLKTFVDFGDNSYEPAVVTQAQWAQLEEKAKDGQVLRGDVVPHTEVGTLTGHVGYDLVDEEAVSFGDDWTSLNLGGRTYQLPNGTDVVNGILIDSDDSMGKKLRADDLAEDPDIDPDYANRPWHGYLSVNAINNTQTPGADDIIRLGMQAGLAGNESNTLAKATGDRAATSVEMVNKTIDLNWLQDHLDFSARDFSEQDGQLQAKTGWSAFGVYIPYVEKTVTRTINVTAPDGKMTTVKQTATLAKQIAAKDAKDAHPDWTTGEWASYDVPTIPGYIASQTSVAATPVDGNTKDQTVNITYTANNQTLRVNYVDTEKADKIVYATTVTGKTGETVNLNLTVPDKYQLADGQQLPTTYTFAAYNGDVTIDLVHKVVQREAKIDAQIALMTTVYSGNDDDDEYLASVVTQNQWTHLDNEIKDSRNPNSDKLYPLVKVGTLTGHVNYDLVDNKVVSFGDGWTSLNLGGQTYQMPDGTEVVNGMFIKNDLTWGKTLKEELLKYHPGVDPDYVNQPWHGYLSVNKTNMIASDFASDNLQAGLVGNESNALAKSIGDQAATVVKMANKTIDSNWLNDNVSKFAYSDSEFSEQNGRLQASVFLPVIGVYIPYVEKMATRTINVVTPDGKTSTVKQTATLAKQVDLTKNDHPAWTTGEWVSYDVPTIPGYTASQSNVAKETVTGETKDQTVNITYTANNHAIHINYVDDEQGEKVVGTGTVSGKTGAAVTITPSLPSGYMLTPGKDAPSTYVVTDAANQVVTIHVQKQFVDTSATDPQAKQTRTVTLHYVYGGGPKDGQKAFDDAVLNVYYHRTATLDRATNQTTYGDWLWDQSQGDPSTPGYHVVSGKWTSLPQHWANVTADVPSIKGYYADLGQNDPANTNHVPANVWVYPTWNGAGSAGDTLDGHESKAYQTSAHLYEVQPEHTVKYMPNKTTLTINYVDDDNKGAVVGHQSWNGTTGQHIDLTLTPPDNYVLSPGWSNPTNYDFDGVNNAWYNVHVKHAVQTQTVTSQMTIHYVNSEDHQRELKAPTVITRQYTRTNISHNDGTTQYGDWSYVPGSFKQTGTPITVRDSDSPVKEDNVYNADKNENMDGFTVIAMYPTIEDYTTHDGIGGVRLTDWLGNSDRQAASLIDNFYAEYDEHKERSIAVKFVDDQAYKQRVGQVTTVTGRDGDTVDLKLTVPDKYQLANGQQLPTSYTFTKGSGDLEIHLVHQVVQHEATIDVQMGLLTAVHIGDGDDFPFVVTQNQWNQLDDKIKNAGQPSDRIYPMVNVGTLTGHVNYDLVDNKVVSFGDDWTTLNLGGHTYQMPDGTEVVNGIFVDYYPGAWRKPVKEELLKYHPDTDPDYTNRPWHGYLSVNTTNNWVSDFVSDNLQAGLVGNEPNTLAKANGDQAATAVKSANKTVDLSLLQYFGFETRDFSEQNSRLHGIAELGVAGVYIPYVEKTATRTINVTTPDGKTAAVKQTATLAKQIDFSKDAHPNWTTSEWASYDVPTIPGYTASQLNAAKETVTGDTKDQIVNITYTANDQSTHVNYVDAQGKTIHTTTVNGKTGQTVKVSNEVPAGWKLVDGQTIPSEITFGPNGYADTSVKIEHQHVTVTPDAPKTTTDHLPDNPGKTYPAGVGHDDLNKTVTGTIKVTMPDGQVKTVVKTAKLTRTADVDEVTGDVKYSDWTTGYWSDYTAPVVPGYTADVPYIAGQSVTGAMTDQTLEITYTANDQSTVVKYVDDKGQVVHTTTVDGVTDQTVKVPSEVPAGWMITKGQVPSEITFGADGHEPIEVTVAHQHVTVDPDHPQTNGTKLPNNPAKTFNGVEANDLNKTITRAIKVTTPDGQTKTVTQTVKLIRNADVDEVTGEVVYGNWTAGQWDAYEVPTVPGYTASQTSVAATPVDGNTKDQTISISYTANSQTTHVNYVDDAGKTVQTTTITGKTGETVKVPNEVPAGWMITKGEVPSEISFGPNGHADETITIGHRHVTVDPDHPQTNGTKLPDNPAKTFNGVEANDLNKTITRTIKVTTPDGKTATTTQTAKLTRTADVDEVTGEVTYGKWTTSEWAAYNAPSVAGYTPSQTTVAKESVTADSKDTTVEITYLPVQHQISVEYIDDDDHGKIVKTDQVPGKTDQTITVTPSAPANYDLIDNGDRAYTVTSDDIQAVQIHVKHHQVTTSESKTVTRTINVHTSRDDTTMIKQTAELTRNVTTDQVTGNETYSDWTTGQWAAYTPEAIPGYTPSTSEVPGVSVDGNTKDQTVDVTYTANAQKVEIIYVDDAKGGAVVKTDQLAGKTDETVKVTPDVPAGYELVGKVPGDYTMTADGHQTITVHLTHQMKTTSESKTVTRTINVHTPHNGVKVVKQIAELTRDVTTDQVTGDKTYGDWSTTVWDRYAVPVVAGYVPNVEQVAQQVVNGTTTDQTVDVTYTSGEHTAHINYVDQDGNVVHTTVIKGQTDGTSQVPNETPAGWTVVGEPAPTELAFGPDGHADVTVTVDHQHVTVTPDNPKTPTDKLPDNPAKTYPSGVGHDDLDKIVTRTIKVTTPDGQTKTVAQKVQLTRTADVDEVIGKVTYDKWTTGEWSSYEVPAVPGYTASQNEVPAVNVTADTKDQTVTVTYTANDQTTHINYVDGNGKIVHTTTVTGKTDQTVKVPNEVPTGWTIIDGQVPSEVTFGANGHDNVTVTVGHHHVIVTPDKPQTDGTQLLDNPSKTFHGVSEADLNKVVTRTIEIASPARKTTTVKQTAKLTRTADVDEVTGEVTYGKWTTGSWSSYTVPTVAGYTPSQAVVAETAVNANTADQTVKIAYTAGSHTTHINYVDKDGNVVHTTTVTGATDQTVKVPNETPAGWKVTGDQVPSEVTFSATGHDDVVITVDHQHVTVTPDNPKTPADKLPNNPDKNYPSGVSYDDLNKTITRTIKVAMPNGQTKTAEQKVQLTRTADVDEATGEVTYGDWTTGSWEAYQVPTVPGYTASQATVPATAVTAETEDQTVSITYTADSHTTHINYVDENGNVVHTTTVTGQTDQTVKVPNETPAGWTITTGKVPSEVTFGANGYDNVDVTVGHKTVTVTPDQPQTDGTHLPDNPALTFHGVGEDDLNRTVTREITLSVPGQDPKVVTQTAHLTRTATVDEVTGEVTYGDWTTGHWDAYEAPTVDGYTTEQKMIPAVDVTSETTSQEIAIDYTAVPKETPTVPSDKQSDATQAPAETPTAPAQAPTAKAQAQAAKAKAPQATQAQQLPQTGESHDSMLAPIGAVLLELLGGFGLFAKKRKKDEGEKM